MKDLRLEGKYIITSEILAITGLHIGTSSNTFKIGGIDNAVVKDAEGKPYIPGSSLKGKMRALLEYAEGLVSPKSMMIYVVYNEEKKSSNTKMHMCKDKDCAVCNIFGRNHGEHKVVDENDPRGYRMVDFTDAVTPTRLIVRDATLIKDSITDQMKEHMDFDWTEVKFENNLDRVTSAANPRQTERVPAGARFKSEMVLSVFNGEGNKYLKKVLEAMLLLEDDYLGGQGTRGYGKVAFKNIKIVFRSKKYYEDPGNAEEVVIVENCDSVRDALKNIR
ncbi:MAG: type III-A CRISPR-associated RAMP protein Csm3 [Thermosediminibacteraceae bacterium]|nr:type III-A CRISPR-associated RAMP protein Csm3 [Thermosediminibacteraceae bacterium]